MKNLKDSISEKLSIDSILEKLKVDDIVLAEMFPIDGTFDEMIDFLKEYDFKEVANSMHNSISKILNKERDKCFINYNNTIWFADTSKGEVSGDNPIFLIGKSSKDFSVYTPYKVIVNDNKEEFLKELNKRFGWE